MLVLTPGMKAAYKGCHLVGWTKLGQNTVLVHLLPSDQPQPPAALETLKWHRAAAKRLDQACIIDPTFGRWATAAEVVEEGPLAPDNQGNVPRKHQKKSNESFDGPNTDSYDDEMEEDEGYEGGMGRVDGLRLAPGGRAGASHRSSHTFPAPVMAAIEQQHGSDHKLLRQHVNSDDGVGESKSDVGSGSHSENGAGMEPARKAEPVAACATNSLFERLVQMQMQHQGLAAAHEQAAGVTGPSGISNGSPTVHTLTKLVGSVVQSLATPASVTGADGTQDKSAAGDESKQCVVMPLETLQTLLVHLRQQKELRKLRERHSELLKELLMVEQQMVQVMPKEQLVAERQTTFMLLKPHQQSASAVDYDGTSFQIEQMGANSTTTHTPFGNLVAGGSTGHSCNNGNINTSQLPSLNLNKACSTNMVNSLSGVPVSIGLPISVTHQSALATPMLLPVSLASPTTVQRSSQLSQQGSQLSQLTAGNVLGSMGFGNFSAGGSLLVQLAQQSAQSGAHHQLSQLLGLPLAQANMPSS